MMRPQLSPSAKFAKYWCPKCELPKRVLDPTFPLNRQCKCADNTSRQRVFKKGWPIGFCSPFAPQEWVEGISNMVLDFAVEKVIGFAFLYEVDYSLLHAEEHRKEADHLAAFIAEQTGSCLEMRSNKGFHFASLNIIPFIRFKELSEACERILPVSDYRYLVLRTSRKANEHQMERFIGTHTSPTPSAWPISKWHREKWEMELREHLSIPNGTEIPTGGMTVNYYAWG